jgi:hypothetical protein
MSSQPVPVHPQERVIRGQLGEPRCRGHTQNNKVLQQLKKKQLHRAHATTSQRTAGYRKVAVACNNSQNRATACLFSASN